MAKEQNYTVRDANGTIVNIIVWDGESPWSPGPGFTVKLAKPGDKLPEPPPE